MLEQFETDSCSDRAAVGVCVDSEQEHAASDQAVVVAVEVAAPKVETDQRQKASSDEPELKPRARAKAKEAEATAPALDAEKLLYELSAMRAAVEEERRRREAIEAKLAAEHSRSVRRWLVETHGMHDDDVYFDAVRAKVPSLDPGDENSAKALREFRDRYPGFFKVAADPVTHAARVEPEQELGWRKKWSGKSIFPVKA